MGKDRSSDSDVETKRAQIEQCRNSFRAVQSAHSEHWQQQHEVPRRLYHYTTLSGVVGITSSSTIWASDVRFLNDASELKYAVDLIDTVIGNVFGGITDESLKKLLPRRPGFANWFEYGVRPFVACFCEQDDLLSQWRGYGYGDARAALGLDLSILSHAGHLPAQVYLRKVVYDEVKQKEYVADVVRTWIETAKELLKSRQVAAEELFPYPAIWALQEALSEHHLCFKNPAFSEEREWRLIKLINVREELGLLEDRRRDAMIAAIRERTRKLGVDIPDVSFPLHPRDAEGVEIRFRESSRGLVPYVELPLKDPAGIFTGRLPLWEVIQGPTENPDLALESLNLFLESRGYGFHTKVRTSQIPFRP